MLFIIFIVILIMIHFLTLFVALISIKYNVIQTFYNNARVIYIVDKHYYTYYNYNYSIIIKSVKICNHL